MTNANRYPGFEEERAIVEAGKVLEAVRLHGAYSSVVFDSPTTQAVIARAYGGWARLCSESDAKRFRREFARAWTAYCRQGVKLYGHLPGIIETTNHSNGYFEHIPSPKLIGEPDIARAVLQAAKEIPDHDG